MNFRVLVVAAVVLAGAAASASAQTRKPDYTFLQAREAQRLRSRHSQRRDRATVPV